SGVVQTRRPPHLDRHLARVDTPSLGAFADVVPKHTRQRTQLPSALQSGDPLTGLLVQLPASGAPPVRGIPSVGAGPSLLGANVILLACACRRGAALERSRR